MSASPASSTMHEKTGIVHEEQVQEIQLAEQAEATEHQESLWTIIKRNPLILLIIAYANIGSFMYGFDNLALSIALSMPSFGLVYGTPAADGTFTIATMWQSLWNAMPLLTNMLGAAAAGPIADRVGRKWTFGIGALFSVIGIAIVFIARQPGVFLAGKMVNAISLGICLTNGQIYVSEITPLHLRGIALSAYTFSINFGYLVAASIGFSRISIIAPAGFLNMFAGGWAWPGVLLVGMLLIPESPFYLVRKGNLEKAERALQTLYGKKADIRATLNNIVALEESEKNLTTTVSSSASFLDCFRGTNWRRTRIILYCNAINNMVGIPIISNGPYFMVQAGLSPTKVSMMIEIGIAFGMVSSVYTFFFMTRFGRRKIIFVSTSVAAIFLLMMGIAGCFPRNKSASWTVGISLQLLWFCISSSVGPAMATAGEISSARLRAKSQAVGLAFNYLYSCIWNVVTPYLFNVAPGSAGLLGRIGFIFFAACIITLVVFYFEFPETKDRSFKELDEMFEQKVPTRKFKEYQTHGFSNVTA